MSPSRKYFFITFLVLAVFALLGSYIYLEKISHRTTEITFRPSEKSPADTVKLQRRGEDWFLVDTERTYRQNRSRTIVNPVVLPRAKLKDYAREQWQENNEWLAFQHLYVDYYTPFYEDRFNQNLKPTSEEIRLAYEFWERRHTP